MNLVLTMCTPSPSIYSPIKSVVARAERETETLVALKQRGVRARYAQSQNYAFFTQQSKHIIMSIFKCEEHRDGDACGQLLAPPPASHFD